MEPEDLPDSYMQSLDKTTKSIDLAQRKFLLIPPEIGNFVELEELYAWENRIVYCAMKFSSLELTVRTLPTELSCLKKLKIIVLNSNGFTTFPEVLCQLPFLTGTFSFFD
jgi:hypothetical protein